MENGDDDFLGRYDLDEKIQESPKRTIMSEHREINWSAFVDFL